MKLIDTDKTHKGCAVYLTNGGYEYIIRHGRECDGFEFLVIEQLHDGAIKLVRQYKGEVYKVTKYNGVAAYDRAVDTMEKLHNQQEG
jgi:hypothetical protein